MNLRSHSFDFPGCPPHPVIFDPGDVVLKKHQVSRSPRGLWERQLAGRRLGVDRVLAARALADLARAATVVALAGGPAKRLVLGRARRRGRGVGRPGAGRSRCLAESTQPGNPRVRRAVAAATG